VNTGTQSFAVRPFARIASMHMICLLVFIAAVTKAARAEYKASYTILKEYVRVDVKADGSHRYQLERVIRIDTPQGVDNEGEQRFGYVGSLETVEILEAYTETPDGQRIAVPADQIRTQDVADDDEGRIFSDRKQKIVIYPQLAVGAKLYVRLDNHQHTPYFPGHFFFDEFFTAGLPVIDYRFVLVHDPRIAVKVAARPYQGDALLKKLSGFDMRGGPVAAHSDDPPGAVRYEFSVRQPTAIARERSQLASTDFAAWIGATSFPDWGALGKAYQARSRPHSEPDDAIRALAVSLTAKAASTKDKLRILHDWVAKHIRYLGVYVGAGGFVPRKASEILSTRYGDCKDHVALLEAMLHAVGVDSSPALINLGDAYRLPELAISNPINHVITYIPSLDLYVDSTAQFAAVGTLPTEDSDKPVIITATGEVRRTPRQAPTRDGMRTSSHMTMLADGRIQGQSVMHFKGTYAIDSRQAWHARQHKDPQNIVDSILGRNKESGTGRFNYGDPLDLNTEWVVNSFYELDAVANVPGKSAFSLPNGLMMATIFHTSAYRQITDRVTPFKCDVYNIEETTELKLPAMVAVDRIPQDVFYNERGIHYSASYNRHGKVLRASRRLLIDFGKTVCDQQDAQAWEKARLAIRRDVMSQVFLR